MCLIWHVISFYPTGSLNNNVIIALNVRHYWCLMALVFVWLPNCVASRTLENLKVGFWLRNEGLLLFQESGWITMNNDAMFSLLDFSDQWNCLGKNASYQFLNWYIDILFLSLQTCIINSKGRLTFRCDCLHQILWTRVLLQSSWSLFWEFKLN